VITPALCRAARGLLNWTVRELAERAEVSPATVSRFENERQQPQRSTLRHLQQVFEAEGVEFTNGGSPGVRLRR
jgi:transcriptional regulator with XRE-family HTH domain